MTKRLPIHDKLDAAFETIRACLRELPGDYELTVRRDTVALWDYDERGTGSSYPEVKDTHSFVEFMNKVVA